MQIETDILFEFESLANLVEAGCLGVFEQVQNCLPLLGCKRDAGYLAGKNYFQVVDLLQDTKLLGFQRGPCRASFAWFEFAAAYEVRLLLYGR